MNKNKIIAAVLLALLFLTWLYLQKDSNDIEISGVNSNQTIESQTTSSLELESDDSEHASEENNIAEASVIENNVGKSEDISTTNTVEANAEDIEEDIEDGIDDNQNEIEVSDNQYEEYKFRNKKLLKQHFEKHGIEMGFDTMEEYEKAASDVVNNPNALHKIEQEDGDDVYYVEQSNEFVIVSTDGYLRTYFNPDSGIKYYNKQ